MKGVITSKQFVRQALAWSLYAGLTSEKNRVGWIGGVTHQFGGVLN
jgi:hypothetical protein